MGQQRQTVMVGMSGGVDSSVAAALLQRRGYRVIGGFMKNWSEAPDPVTGRCGWRDEWHDAQRVAARLGLELVTFDFEKQYRESVVDYLVREYAAGRTPNPDVLCNRAVKFDLFLKAARQHGADLIATGHYCRRRQNPDGSFRLLAGRDPNKDQSYFLHQITQRQLSHSLFPIGHLLKPQVRQLARQLKLPVADKKDSQGICFIGQVDLKQFLASRIPQRPGAIVNVAGEQLGQHDGLAPYTIGQRHGLGIGGGTPYFVVEKDVKGNRLIVCRADQDEPLYGRSLYFTQAHWIAGRAPNAAARLHARIRYRQPWQAVRISRPSKTGPWLATFHRRQRAITPGQFIVLYQGQSCLGGGVINRQAD
jgi:tRNA-specific 2-thiouridylase